MLDIAIWAVPFGILGARLYHVISSPQEYFGSGGNPIEALYIWQGGLGIWGAVAGGAVGAWLATRQLGLPLSVVADAVAPGLPLAQAVGRLGNWFNNELYGGPTTLPWGLEIHQMDRENPGQALRDPEGNPVLEPGLYHPTFLYELIWNVGVAGLVILAERRWKLGAGRAFAVYVMGYTAGRFWIEMMRTDPANEILGARLNVWTSVLVFLGALIYLVRVRGPQQFLIPLDADGKPFPPDGLPGSTAAGEPAGDEQPTSGVSQVDVSGKTKAAAAEMAAGYQVVSEEEFQEYLRTGTAPPPTETKSDPVEPTAADVDAVVADSPEPVADAGPDAADADKETADAGKQAADAGPDEADAAVAGRGDAKTDR